MFSIVMAREPREICIVCVCMPFFFFGLVWDLLVCESVAAWVHTPLCLDLSAPTLVL